MQVVCLVVAQVSRATDGTTFSNLSHERKVALTEDSPLIIRCSSFKANWCREFHLQQV